MYMRTDVLFGEMSQPFSATHTGRENGVGGGAIAGLLGESHISKSNWSGLTSVYCENFPDRILTG
jgi:hypothetical protein